MDIEQARARRAQLVDELAAINCQLARRHGPAYYEWRSSAIGAKSNKEREIARLNEVIRGSQRTESATVNERVEDIGKAVAILIGAVNRLADKFDAFLKDHHG